MKFRFDINTLRAIAVFGVLFFHFKVPYFNGGFAGVDIFFVISGYLMSRIIINALNKNEFSIIEFYTKRVKRIVPALLFLIIAVTFFCFFVYLPRDYKITEGNSASSILFLSNIWYWTKSSYFGPASESNVFLHTWSLSVEWQFYLLYPLLLIAFHKLIKNNNLYKVLFIASTLIIFYCSNKFSRYDQSASFYLLPSRSWEMLFGGIAFLFEGAIKGKTASKIISVAGYVILFACLTMLTDRLLWPGKFTFIPVFGTFLVIIANSNDFKLLKLPLVQFLGKISYSLYLWHWPVYVISGYLGLEKNTYGIVFLLALSMLLAYASYRYIESINFRQSKFILAAMCFMFVTTLFASQYNTNTVVYKKRTIELSNYISVHIKDREKQFNEGCCFISVNSKFTSKVFKKDICLKIDTGRKNYLLLGDSHAAQFAQTLKETLPENNYNLIQASASTCFPLIDKNGGEMCYKIIEYVYHDFIKNNYKEIDGVILGANWINLNSGGQG
ncbi:acyltransferase family protein [Mucilaginibacter terrae]|uniref:acyltransferase family protein n=1 Tax=Mucilaginibacter terrae TaxID=1955052 RepID=UPI003628DA23